ncbi:MAG: 5-formyltetrahydrofolate cyclo-ligase [Candidatus Omnitrophica bacterium]|nr:5-formyltetrahydrofolate cyclo-ligase [Candidatus Omnitrophota bacterium]
MLRRLQQQKENERLRKSAHVRRRLARVGAFRRAKTVCCYVALPYEVETRRLMTQMLETGKRVVVPLVRGTRLVLSELRDLDTDLAPGAYGVWEPVRSAVRPVPVKDVDLVLVPGLGFDRRGHRLGHGLGYYDRLLARLPKTTATIGLCFDFQQLDRLPTAPHDHAVQRVLAA